MRFEINSNPSLDYTYIQTEGDASVQGFKELLNQVIESENWEPGTKQIVDHRKLTLSHLSPGDMGEIAGILNANREKIGDGRCAFVISDKLGFGFARMYGLLGGEDIHAKVGVFYDIDEAVEWIKS